MIFAHILCLLVCCSASFCLPLGDAGNLDNRIVGGQAVDIGAYGYQISLRIKSIFNSQDSYRHTCGGSIYSDKIIITAAHCIIATVPSQLKVVAGTNLQSGVDGVMVPVQEIIMHERFDPKTLNNDIALLVLPIPLPLNGFNIRPIELIDQKPIAGLNATVTGWGALNENGPTPDQLQAVKVPIVSHGECNEDYQGDITETMLCAGLRGLGGSDACHNDSGGPLTIRNKLAGIVSWGEGCARPEYPGVYADVWSLKEWIWQKVVLYKDLAVQ